MYKIKNMTYQPIRLVFDTYSVRLNKRTTVVVEELTDQIINLNLKGIIRAKKSR